MSLFVSLLSAPSNSFASLLPSAGGDEFHAPGLIDFFPPAIFGEGTFFEFNRIMLIRVISTAVLCLLFYFGARNLRLVPSRGQSVLELGVNFVRENIAIDMLGEKRGRAYAPLITLIFFAVFAMNITGVIPGLNVAGAAVVGFPFVLAMISLVAFVSAGVKAQGGLGYLKATLFPPGVPWPIYFILTPIEILSVFILRPATLTIRLLVNMMSGHLLLALTFASTQYLLFHAATFLKPLGVGTFVLALTFVLFEIFVSTLQAYIFALLTTVYISMSVEAH